MNRLLIYIACTLALLIPTTALCWMNITTLGGGVAATGGGGSTYAVTFEGYTSSTTYTNTAIECVIPTEALEGHMAIATWHMDTAGVTAGTAPTGWTQLEFESLSGEMVTATYYKELTSAGIDDADAIVSFPYSDNAGGKVCRVAVYEKAGGSWSTLVSDTASGDYATLPDMTVAGYASGALHADFTFDNQGVTVSTSPSGMTQIGTLYDGGSLSMSSWYQESITDANYSKAITWSTTNGATGVLISLGAE